MSIEAREWVQNVAPATATDRDRVVLDVLADIANKKGRNVFPSRETIAWRAWRDTSESGIRKARRALKALREGGWITVDESCDSPVYRAMRGDRRPTAYRLNLDLEHQTRRDTGDPSQRGDTGDPSPPPGDTGGRTGGHKRSPRGDTGDPQTGREPGENREGARGNVGDASNGPQQSPAPSPKSLDELAARHAAGAPGTGGTTDRCEKHSHIPPGQPVPPCIACRAVRVAAETAAAERDRQDAAERLARREALTDCPQCDEAGWKLNPVTGDPLDPATKCSHPIYAQEA